MRWLVRLGLALALLLVLAVGGLLVVLPRLAASDAVKERIQRASRELLGREFDYATIDFGLLPPALQVESPVVSGESPEAPPLARADRIALRAALLPLLGGSLEVRSLVAEGLELHLVRTGDGLALPGGGRPSSGPGAEGGGSESGEEGGGGSSRLASIRRVVLRDARISVEDRTRRPAARWELADVWLEGRPRGARVELSGAAKLASGGALELDGRLELGGDSDLTLELADFALAPLSPYLGEAAAGAVSGSARLRGDLADPGAELGLRFVDAAYGATRLAGTADLEARIEAAISAPRGPFALDLDDAALAGSGFAKPAGTRARLAGTLAPDANGAPAVDDLHLELHNLDARGSLHTAPRLRAQLRAEPFELEGWQELLPALALLALEGRLAAPELTLQTAPLEAHGVLRLEDWLLRPPGREPALLAGEIELLGDALRSRDLVARVADQTLGVRAEVQSLFRAPRYSVDFETAETGAEADALLRALAGQPDRLFGPLVGAGSLRGSLGEGFLDALQGDVNFAIAPGRIVGVSLLESVLGPLGARLARLGADRAEGDLRRFYSEEFEKLTAALRVEGGQLIARPVTLEYRDYSATLEGPLSLADLSLDLTGSLRIQETLDAELARAFGAGEAYVPRSRTLPLASVGGKLGAPKVQLSGKAVQQVAAAYAADAYTGELREKIEKELGEGSGTLVDEGLKALEGLLGGARRPAREPPAPEVEPEPAPETSPAAPEPPPPDASQAEDAPPPAPDAAP